MAAKLTDAEVKRRAHKIAPAIKILSKYASSQAPLKCKCYKCHHVWNSTWNRILHGSGCYRCGIKKAHAATSLTHEEIVRSLHAINPNIKLLQKYSGSCMQPINCKCCICKHEWSPTWNSLSKGVGCPRCGIEKAHNWERLLTVDVIAKLHKISPTIEVLGEYFGKKNQRVKVRCKQCGNIWNPTWYGLSQGYGCRLCYSRRTRYTTAEIKEKMTELHPNVTIVGEYTGYKSPLECECHRCQYKWITSWMSLSRGSNCPRCAGNFKTEEEVRIVIERLTGSKFPKAGPSQVPFLHGLHLDGYDADHRRAFEYDGQQHRRVVPHFHGKRDPRGAFLRQKRRDKRKSIQCWRHGVQLLRIPHFIKNKEVYIKNRLIKLGWIETPATQVQS